MDRLQEFDRRLTTLERRQELELQMLSAISRYLAGDTVIGKPVVRTSDKLTWYSVLYGLLALVFGFWYAGLTLGGWLSDIPDKAGAAGLLVAGAIAAVSFLIVLVWGGKALGEENPPFGAASSIHVLRQNVDNELRSPSHRQGHDHE